METFETYRNAVITRLSADIPADMLAKVAEAIDLVSVDYTITRTSTQIIPASPVPDSVVLYLASRALENIGKTTLDLYRRIITNFFLAIRKPVDQISTNDVRHYLYQYKSNRRVCDHTLDMMRTVLSVFFSWLVANDYILRNPVSKIQKIKYQQPEKQPLSPHTLELMRLVCRDIREKALVDFLFSTGCRVSECAAAELTDINWQDRSVVVRHGKGDKRRVVFFNAESEVSLKKYLGTRNDRDPHIFVILRSPHTALNKRGIERLIKAIRERMTTPVDCTPHTFRRTFATTSIRAGMPLERLQALMGHSKPETTMIYARLCHDDLRRAHQMVFT